MTLSDFAKYSMTRSVARSLCDSWASCFIHPLHSTPPSGEVPVGILPSCLVWIKLEWWSYPMVKKLWKYYV